MLLAWAAVTKSTVVLELAVLGMFAVGGATLTFVILLRATGRNTRATTIPTPRASGC